MLIKKRKVKFQLQIINYYILYIIINNIYSNYNIYIYKIDRKFEFIVKKIRIMYMITYLFLYV